eukprot:scaffold46222_cov40-Cyclotella_meneghiniana.AAC.2
MPRGQWIRRLSFFSDTDITIGPFSGSNSAFISLDFFLRLRTTVPSPYVFREKEPATLPLLVMTLTLDRPGVRPNGELTGWYGDSSGSSFFSARWAQIMMIRSMFTRRATSVVVGATAVLSKL